MFCLPVFTAHVHIYRGSEEDEYSVVCQIQHVVGAALTITLKHNDLSGVVWEYCFKLYLREDSRV